MNLHLGADVRERTGDKLGELQGVVFELEGQRVLALVVQHAGLQGRDVLVSLRKLAGVEPDGEVMYMDLTMEQFDSLTPLHSETHNVAPPPLADNVTSDLVDDPVDIPDVPPVGAATGVESIAYTPILEEQTNLRTGDIVIGRTTLVVATDGDVGHVVRIFLDDNRPRIVSLVAERGLLFTHDVEVPFDLVTRIDAEQVLVDVSRGELSRLSRQ